MSGLSKPIKFTMENNENINEMYNYKTESECLCYEFKQLKSMENVYDFEHCLLKRDIQSYELMKKAILMRNERDHEIEVHCSNLKNKYYMLIDFISDFDIDDIARYKILEKGIQYNKEKDHLSSMISKYTDIRKEFEEVILLNSLKSKQIELETMKNAFKFRLSAHDKISKEMNDMISQEELHIQKLIVALVVGCHEIPKQIHEVMKLKKDCERLEASTNTNSIQNELIVKELEADIKKLTELLESQANQINEFGILSTILPKKSIASKIQIKLNLLEINNKFSKKEFPGIKSFNENNSCDKSNKFNSKKTVFEKENVLSQTVTNRETVTDNNKTALVSQTSKNESLDVLTGNSTDIQQESILPNEKNKISKNIQVQPTPNAAGAGYKRGAKRRSSTSSEDKYQISKQRRIEKQKRKLKSTKNDVLFLVPGMANNDKNVIQNDDMKTPIVNPKCNANQAKSNMSFFENISNSGSFILSSGDEKDTGKDCNESNNLERSDSFQFDSDSFDLVFDEHEKANDDAPGDTEIGSFFL